MLCSNTIVIDLFLQLDEQKITRHPFKKQKSKYVFIIYFFSFRVTYSDTIAGPHLKRVAPARKKRCNEAFRLIARECDSCAAIRVDHIHFILGYHRSTVVFRTFYCKVTTKDKMFNNLPQAKYTKKTTQKRHKNILSFLLLL